MNTRILKVHVSSTLDARSGLGAAAAVWFFVALVGQLYFSYFLTAGLGGESLGGRFYSNLLQLTVWHKLAFTAHVLLTLVIIVNALLQASTSFHSHTRKLHQVSVRLYVSVAFVASVAALVLHVLDGSRGAGAPLFWGNALNSFCILVFAMLTWMTALSDDLQEHNRWMLRTFFALSGIWFLRIFIGGLIFITGGEQPELSSGPLAVLLACAYTLIPLGVLEVYFKMQARSSEITRWWVASLIMLLSLFTAIGIHMANTVVWMPGL